MLIDIAFLTGKHNDLCLKSVKSKKRFKQRKENQKLDRSVFMYSGVKLRLLLDWAFQLDCCSCPNIQAQKGSGFTDRKSNFHMTDANMRPFS